MPAYCKNKADYGDGDIIPNAATPAQLAHEAAVKTWWAALPEEIHSYRRGGRPGEFVDDYGNVVIAAPAAARRELWSAEQMWNWLDLAVSAKESEDYY